MSIGGLASRVYDFLKKKLIDLATIHKTANKVPKAITVTSARGKKRNCFQKKLMSIMLSLCLLQLQQ
jgi:hypothetical protein